MRLNLNAIADVVVQESEGKTKPQIASMMKDLVRFLTAQRTVVKWREFERAIDGAWARRFGTANVTIVSSHPLSAAARKAIDDQANGADVKAIVDERLIGGAVVRMDNRRIDGSITGALMRLKNVMYSEV